MIRRANNARSTNRSELSRFASDALLRPGQEPPLASHLITQRTLYTHHGIYVGNGRVIHYAGLAYERVRGPVEDVSLERFAHGHNVRVRCDQRRFDPRTVVERARSRLGERSYRILTNNCEHFCAWALHGESRSSQVERLCTAPRAMCRAIGDYCRLVIQHHRRLLESILNCSIRPGAARAPSPLLASGIRAPARRESCLEPLAPVPPRRRGQSRGGSPPLAPTQWH